MQKPEKLPPQIWERARTLLVDSVTEEMIRAFRAADIESILLKGPSISRWLYATDETRPYVDIDLLVPEPKFHEAEDILADRGFTFSDPPVIRGDRPRHANSWMRSQDGTAVDLHRTIIGAGADAQNLWESLWRRTEPMLLRTIDVQVLQRPARCVLLALHAANHATEWTQPLEDLKRALTAVDKEVWQSASEVAEEIAAADSFCLGLSLLPEGEKLLTELSLFLAPRVESTLRAEGTPAALGLQWLMEVRGPLNKVTLLIRKAFPPPAYMRDWTPLARKGAIGLIISYLWRPLFLLRRLPRAVRALRRARSKARVNSSEPSK